MANFRRKTLIIDAVRLAHSGTVDTPQGTIDYQAGDWLLTGVDGEQYTVPNKRFLKLYEPADEAATEYLERNAD